MVGVVISPLGSNRVGPVEKLYSEHPIPGGDTLHVSQTLLQYLESADRRISCFLISGALRDAGGSPSETWLGEFIKRGADIVELNAVRKMLLRIKGGGCLG